MVLSMLDTPQIHHSCFLYVFLSFQCKCSIIIFGLYIVQVIEGEFILKCRILCVNNKLKQANQFFATEKESISVGLGSKSKPCTKFFRLPEMINVCKIKTHLTTLDYPFLGQLRSYSKNRFNQAEYGPMQNENHQNNVKIHRITI